MLLSSPPIASLQGSGIAFSQDEELEDLLSQETGKLEDLQLYHSRQEAADDQITRNLMNLIVFRRRMRGKITLNRGFSAARLNCQRERERERAKKKKKRSGNAVD